MEQIKYPTIGKLNGLSVEVWDGGCTESGDLANIFVGWASEKPSVISKHTVDTRYQGDARHVKTYTSYDHDVMKNAAAMTDPIKLLAQIMSERGYDIITRTGPDEALPKPIKWSDALTIDNKGCPTRAVCIGLKQNGQAVNLPEVLKELREVCSSIALPSPSLGK